LALEISKKAAQKTIGMVSKWKLAEDFKDKEKKNRENENFVRKNKKCEFYFYKTQNILQ
jgi:5'-deoxynucleotidase YfbR-like HD superfamily hydrolase